MLSMIYNELNYWFNRRCLCNNKAEVQVTLVSNSTCFTGRCPNASLLQNNCREGRKNLSTKNSSEKQWSNHSQLNQWFSVFGFITITWSTHLKHRFPDPIARHLGLAGLDWVELKLRIFRKGQKLEQKKKLLKIYIIKIITVY